MKVTPTGRPKHNEEIVYQLVLAGEFEIDDEGRVWRVADRRGWPGKPNPCAPRRAEERMKQGYLVVAVKRNRHTLRAAAHRLVWRHFHGSIPGELTVNHKDGRRDNNHPDNLELATLIEQQQHSVHVLKRQNGVPGERHYAAKLSNAQVAEIRVRRAKGELLRTIAADYGVGQPTVSQIANGQARRQG